MNIYQIDNQTVKKDDMLLNTSLMFVGLWGYTKIDIITDY